MEIDINDCIARVKAYKQYLRDKIGQVASRFTYEEFKHELILWTGTKFTDWADHNQLDIMYNDETKEIGLRSQVDNDICVMVRCKVSMAQTMLKAMEQVKKERKK